MSFMPSKHIHLIPSAITVKISSGAKYPDGPGPHDELPLNRPVNRKVNHHRRCTSKRKTSTEVNPPKAEWNKWDNKPRQTHHSTRFARLLITSSRIPLHYTTPSFRETTSLALLLFDLFPSFSSFMALFTFLPEPSSDQPKEQQSRRKRKPQKNPSSSWDQVKNLLTCKQIEGSQVHDPSKNAAVGYSKLGSSCSSICSFRDVVHGNTRVVHRADNSPESSSVGQETGILSQKPVTRSSTRSISRSGVGATCTPSSKAMQFRKLSGCYECRMIVDPSRYIVAIFSPKK